MRVDWPDSGRVAQIAGALFIIMVGGCGGGGGSGAPPAPSGLSYTSPNLYPIGSAIAPLPPTVSGTVTQYSVAPALPAGLAINSTTGVVLGTPTAPTPATTYRITAQNSSGSTSFDLSIAVITVTAAPATVSRMVMSGTSVAMAVALTPVNFIFSGTLTAAANDTNAVIVPTISVDTASNSYTLWLNTSTTIAPGHYTGTVTVSLCNGTPCAMPQRVASVQIPYDISVLTFNSAWPGNNLSKLAPWPGVPDWTMFQGNAAHTGYVDVVLDPNQFTTRWQGPLISSGGLGGSRYPNNMTLTTTNGVFFVATGDILYARNESDASVVWSYDVSGLADPSTNPPAVANGTVYMAAGQQGSTYMFAFNATDGSVVFKSPMASQWEHYLAPTVGPSGVYTDAGEYGGLYGFNSSGTQLFFDGTDMQDEWTPAADANYVYAYTGSALRIVDPVTGAQHLSIADPTFSNYVYEIGGSVVLGAPGYAFAAAYENSLLNGCGIGNTLLGFNTTAGTIAWKIPGCFPSTPAYHAGLLYVASANPLRLEARSETDGSLQWSWTPPLAGDSNFESEVLLTQNVAFVSTNNAIYGVDTATHKTVWSYPVNGGARLALSANGILYIESAGPLAAINMK